MNEILKKIIDIENEAKELMLEAELMERGAQDAINKAVETMRAKVDGETDKKVEKTRADEQMRYEASVKKQDADFETQIKSLESQFTQNAARWQEEVYQRVIS